MIVFGRLGLFEGTSRALRGQVIGEVGAGSRTSLLSAGPSAFSQET